MDIIVLIPIVFFAVSVIIVVRVIINKRKRWRESKKEEEEAQKEQEKLAQKAAEDSRKQPEVEAKAKKGADDKAHKEAEVVAKKAEDEAKKNAEEKARLATALKHEIEERIKTEEKAAEERLRKEREEESLRKEEERLEKIKAEEEKIEREAREKASKEKVERERLEAEEKESKAEQEVKARKEETKKKEELEHRLKGEGEEREEEQELPPDKRGGRPRGSTKQRAMPPSGEPKPCPLKPEIICWNKGWERIVGIEVPEEFESPRVTQNDELLEQDTSDAALYHLRHFEGIVRVAWIAGEQDREIDIPIMEDGRNYLIFKMRRDWKGLGRLVKRPTAGYYLAIVPQEWTRDEEMSGSAPVAPENVQIDGYKAHFFFLRQNEDTPVAFVNTTGERIQVEPESSRFQLVGKEISDSSDDMGPLFGEEPPRIKTIDEREWSNVGVVVVGEEGSGRNRWRMQFVPQEGAKEQRMPDELTNRQGGWYFVRIYDDDDDLLESMDFRFIVGLKDIQIMNSECLPEPDGYNDVSVQFVHQVNYKVKPANGEMHNALKIHRENYLTIVTVPPKPDYDKIQWIVRDGDAVTKVTVLVERIWWCVGRMEVVPTNWMDKPVSLSRKDFTAITDKTLWMKLPRSRWISKIDVGFNLAKSRSYNVEVEKKEIAIPLRDFCDAKEIENKQEESTMKMWVSPEGTKTYEAIVLRIPAELPPSVKPKTPQVKPPPSEPVAEVKSPRGKLRKGKGFSKREIIGAGLTMEDVKRLHLPHDKRRKSSNSWNIERLESVTKR
jgi:ribosomal protein L13E